MAVYLGLEKENEQRAKVVLVHYNPDQLPQEMIGNGVIVDAFEQPEVPMNKIPIVYWNYNDKKVEVEFLDRPLTPEEITQQLQADLGNVLLESANDKAKISSLEATVGDLLMEVAALKTGGNV
ncbi:hypothetical protein CD798_08545 [Bacillaceae bacterium SAOS 7]|nr:hypothetical protein CD798_08545 [Bacillaceae bacterium SAOS 7]